MLSSVRLERKLLAWPGITASLGKVVCLESVLFVCLAARALFIRMSQVCGWMQAKCAPCTSYHLTSTYQLPHMSRSNIQTEIIIVRFNIHRY